MEIAAERVHRGLALRKKRDFTHSYVYNEHSHPIHPFRSERRHFNLSTTKKSSQSIESHSPPVIHTNSISLRIDSKITRLRNNRNYIGIM